MARFGSARSFATAISPRTLIRQRYPVLSQALLAGASGPIAKPGDHGREPTAAHPMRVLPRRQHAVQQARSRLGLLGAGGLYPLPRDPRCIRGCVAVHPSDMAVAMAALDASVVVTGRTERRIRLTNLHRLPATRPIGTPSWHGELITAVDLPALVPGTSAYCKVRDRASYFALISVAAALA